MAVLWIDGFECYQKTLPLIRRYSKVSLSQQSTIFNGPSYIATPGRLAYGKCLVFFGDSFTTTALSGSGSTHLFIGVAFKNMLPASSTGTFNLITFQDTGGVDSLALTFNPSTGLLGIWSTSGLNLTGTTSLQYGVWNHLQLDVVQGSSTGSVWVGINATQEINSTNVNTLPTSTNPFNFVKISKPTVARPGSIWLDDMYIGDSSGSSNNSRLGDLKIEALTITANGGTTQWTSQNASSNYLAVQSNDSAYVYSAPILAGSTQLDLYATSAPQQLVGNINAVAINVYARRVDNNAYPMNGNVCNGSSTITSSVTTTIASASELWQQYLFPTDCNGSVWTAGSVTANTFGFSAQT